MSGQPWLKPLRRRRAWLGLWWLAIAIVIVACLVPGGDLPQLPVSDKVEHALAFLLLAASGVQLYRTGKPLLVVGLGLLALGILIELAQHAFSSSRVMEPADVLADAIGILLGLGTAWTPRRDVLRRLDRL